MGSKHVYGADQVRFIMWIVFGHTIALDIVQLMFKVRDSRAPGAPGIFTIYTIQIHKYINT